MFFVFQYIFRLISQESTTHVRKGRQTLCNLRQQSDFSSVESNEDSLTSELLNRLIQKGYKHDIIQTSFTSFESTNRLNPPKSKSFDSVRSWPSLEHKAQTCRRTNQKQTCTTKTPPPNCSYRHHRKTYSSNHQNRSKSTSRDRGSYDGNSNCINIDTNNTEWYIQLASNCYRNGFQLHVNHLDEWSKHPCVLQRKPEQVPVLRLASSALLSRSQSIPIDLSATVSTVADLVECSSSKSIRVASSHCDKTDSNTAPSDRLIKNLRRPHQLNTDEFKRIACTHSALRYNHSIDDKIKLPIIDTIPIAQKQHQPQLQQSSETKQFNALNAKNNMNIAVDANNLQQNLQLSCQAIQYNYQNNNLTFDREFQANGERVARTIAVDNNNYRNQYWANESNPNPILLTNRNEVWPPSAGDIVNDLIDAFNTSFAVSEANQTKLPQIILSDFSSNQPTPTTTPLFFAIQSTRTLSEHPDHLQEFQLSKPLHQSSTTATTTSTNEIDSHILNHRSF